MGELITRDMMTVRQVAIILDKDESTIRKIGKNLFPNIFQNGKTTYLTEAQVTAIKLNLGKNSELPKTKLEKQLLIRQAIQLQDELIAELQAENQQLSSTVNMLTHSNKTYTTTEIGKELNFKSPQEFNAILHGMKVIFKVNGTWVLTSQYAGQGYTETKQQEVNGIVIYNTQWTDKGRVFLLNLFPDRINKEEELI